MKTSLKHHLVLKQKYNKLQNYDCFFIKLYCKTVLDLQKTWKASSQTENRLVAGGAVGEKWLKGVQRYKLPVRK